MIRLLFLLLPVIAMAGEPLPNPFFAMDTAVRSLDKMETVKQLGYDGLGWKLGPPEEITAAVQQLKTRNLQLFAVYAGSTLTKTELTLAPQLEADMPALKGTNTLLWLPIYSKEFACSSEEGDAVAVPALIRLADLAATHGLRVAIYPHKGAWAERVQDAVRLANKVNRPNLGATFNLCHCLMVGDEPRIPELLEQALPRLFVVTINGADTGAGGTQWDRLIRPLDEGTFDTRLVLNKLSALGYRGPIGLQGYGIKLPPEDNLRRSMAAWAKLTSTKP